jgi:hypothetical protein
MPLQASHIKFALELKDIFNVEDLGKYLAGVIYPDSRYFTGVDRHLTHDKKLIDHNFFAGNDFRKGWVSHLVADKAYDQEIGSIFPEESKNWDEEWYKINSAAKIVADLKAAKDLNFNELFPFFDLIENSNGENEFLMKKYIAATKDLYGKPDLKVGDYAAVFPPETVGKEIVDEIIKNSLIFLGNKNLMAQIDDLFDDKIVKKIKEEWLSKIT